MPIHDPIDQVSIELGNALKEIKSCRIAPAMQHLGAANWLRGSLSVNAPAGLKGKMDLQVKQGTEKILKILKTNCCVCVENTTPGVN